MITMMRRYRKALQIGLLVVIAAFVASLFVFGTRGFGDGAGSGKDWVARVNGEEIPIERYQRRYQAYSDAYAQMFKNQFTPEMAERMGLAQRVVDDLVQEAVIVQRAGAEGLSVSDEELNAQIHAVTAFHEGGRFSLKRYQELLKRRGMTPAIFERDVRRELTRFKVEGAIKSGVKVSATEVEKAFATQREEVRAAWTLVELAPLVAATQVTDAELEGYLKGHQAEFRQPDRRRVQYVLIGPKEFVQPASEAEIEKYYSEHAADFETPRQVKASHVLARVGETGGSEAEDKAKAKIADVIRRARAGEPFAKLAKELSEDPGSAAKGGDLGVIRKGEMVPEFEQAALTLKKGEISPEPVRSPFGYHAIVVTDVQEGGKKPLAAVAPQIRDRLAADHADRAAKAKADEVRPALSAASDFMAEAKKLGLNPLESRFPRTAPATRLPRGESLEETAFSLALNGVSSPVKSPAGYAIIKALEDIPAAVPPLAEIKEQVGAALKQQKAETAGLERAKQIAAEARGGDLTAAAKKAGATTGEPARFSRAKPADKIPGDAMVAALQTVSGGVTEPVKTPQGFYVLKVLERAPADMSDLDKEREKLSTELLAKKQSQAWESWIATAKAGAKVETSDRIQTPRRG